MHILDASEGIPLGTICCLQILMWPGIEKAFYYDKVSIVNSGHFKAIILWRIKIFLVKNCKMNWYG
jgi:hypothetical protein